MRPVLVTMNVVVDAARHERRDTLDQAWADFLAACDLLPVPVPNRPAAVELIELAGAGGVLLTGGNDLAAYGGTAPERDAAEEALVAAALERRLPVLGVCRGMQLLLHRFGAGLEPVDGHVSTEHTIETDEGPRIVNSFHRWAARESAGPLRVTARAADGVIEAVAAPELRLTGIMWHPERRAVADARDTALFHETFAGGQCAR
ncbi:gamma-glutamyl-gamma-aminobutyrate hydrolase family protein [Microbispora sp. CA-102843]|uniref:gamma-glutamyl-gamma-aminobutyrate hydrolase family protein n=1 Tax=Microbispora sp. CA-102843 TaxID=3239952 RepID=UPI003D8CE98A